MILKRRVRTREETRELSRGQVNEFESESDPRSSSAAESAMGSDQSAPVNPAAISSASAKIVKDGDGKNFAYLSPIGSNENINASSGGSGGTPLADEASNKRTTTSAPNGVRPADVSPAVDASKVPTLQAQLQAKVSAHVVSGVATASQKLDAASALIGRAPGKSATSDAIIVVHSGKVAKEETAEDDPNLLRMKQVPMCYPLLKGPASLSNEKSSKTRQAPPPDAVVRLKYKEALTMGVRYQEHLRRCADAVAFDQNSLCTRVKEIDFAVNQLMSMLSERQKKYAKLAEQVSKTSDILQSVRSVRSTIDGLVPLMNDINSGLPEHLRLDELPLNVHDFEESSSGSNAIT